MSFHEHHKQVERLVSLKIKAGVFQAAAEELWWHSTNGYGLTRRAENLRRLHDELMDMVLLVEQCIAKEGEPDASER